MRRRRLARRERGRVPHRAPADAGRGRRQHLSSGGGIGRARSREALPRRLPLVRAAPVLPRHRGGAALAGGGADPAGPAGGGGDRGARGVRRLLLHGLARRAAAALPRPRGAAVAPAEAADGGQHRRRLRPDGPGGLHGGGRAAGEPGRRQRGGRGGARGRHDAGAAEADAGGAGGHARRPGAGPRRADGAGAARAHGGAGRHRPCRHAHGGDPAPRLLLPGAGLRPLPGRRDGRRARRHQGGDAGAAGGERRGEPAPAALAGEPRDDGRGRLRADAAGRDLRHHRARLHPRRAGAARGARLRPHRGRGARRLGAGAAAAGPPAARAAERDPHPAHRRRHA